MRSLISIIVPIYNIDLYLCECIESLINQTYTGIEIILVDDGSTDNSGKICDEYVKRDSRIKVIHKKNEGLVRARKDGLSAATGKYIIYVDGDDWIETDFVECMLSVVKENNADIVIGGRYDECGGSRSKHYQGVSEGYYDKKKLIKDIYPRMISKADFFEFGIYPTAWGKMYRKDQLEIFQNIVDDRLTFGEDVAFVYELLLNADSLFILDKCLYHYRQREQSMVRKIDNSNEEKRKFLNLHNFVWNRLKNYDKEYDLKNQWLRFLMFSMVPRAEILYDGFENLDYLFPYPKVRKGSNIIVYGMGLYGQRLYNYLKKTKFCNVIAAFDRNYDGLNKIGLNVESPENISEFEYDAMIITCSYAGTRFAVYSEMIEKYPADKIHIMDEDLVFSNETIRRFNIDLL